MPDLAREDAAAVPGDGLGGAVPERRLPAAGGGAARGGELDGEGGDLAALAELGGALHVDDGDPDLDLGDAGELAA